VKKNSKYWYEWGMKKVSQWFINALQAQCIALLTCLPILVTWGLPISLMSIIGNIIFTPFFACFLLISSLVFFTELFLIPNTLLIKTLSIVTACWQYLLSYGRKEWLIGFIPPHPLILLAIPGATAYHFFWKRKQTYSLTQLSHLGFACVLTFSLLYAHTQLCKLDTSRIASNHAGQFKCFFNNEQKLIFIDNGYFSKKRNVEKAVQYSIKPHLLKTFGTTHFAYIILSRVNGRSMSAAYNLALTCPVDAVVVPYFKGTLSSFGWFSYFRLQKYAQKHHIRFIRIDPNNVEKLYTDHSS